MGRKYAIRNQWGLHFVTFTVVDWVDLFTRDCYRQVFIDSLIYAQVHKNLLIHAYCIMPNHVHLILSAKNGNLSRIIRDIKGYTSNSLRKTISTHPSESRKGWMLRIFSKAGRQNKRNRDFQLWQQHNHPIELDNNYMLDQRLDYIHNNPLVAGFVRDPTAWVWSSCAGYERNIDHKIQLNYIE